LDLYHLYRQLLQTIDLSRNELFLIFHQKASFLHSNIFTRFLQNIFLAYRFPAFSAHLQVHLEYLIVAQEILWARIFPLFLPQQDLAKRSHSERYPRPYKVYRIH